MEGLCKNKLEGEEVDNCGLGQEREKLPFYPIIPVPTAWIFINHGLFVLMKALINF